jgi:hypothetical protein
MSDFANDRYVIGMLRVEMAHRRAVRRKRVWTVVDVVVSILLGIWLLTACHHQCPVAVAPPPVTIKSPPLPCSLPPLPSEIKIIGFPNAADNTIYVSKSDWTEIGVYLKGIRNWIESAQICLTRQGAP